jgi:hypothetical protein
MIELDSIIHQKKVFLGVGHLELGILGVGILGIGHP